MLRTQTYMVSSLRRVARQDRDGGEALEVRKRGTGPGLTRQPVLGAVLPEARCSPRGCGLRGAEDRHRCQRAGL